MTSLSGPMQPIPLNRCWHAPTFSHGFGRTNSVSESGVLPIFYACTAAIFSHCCAQRSHASAHFWQCSTSCFRHSSAHSRHASAHSRQMSAAKSESPLINSEAARHKVEQSRSSSMQRAIIFTSRSPKHSLAHHVHSLAQWLQASMQSMYFLLAITLLCCLLPPLHATGPASCPD